MLTGLRSQIYDLEKSLRVGDMVGQGSRGRSGLTLIAEPQERGQCSAAVCKTDILRCGAEVTASFPLEVSVDVRDPVIQPQGIRTISNIISRQKIGDQVGSVSAELQINVSCRLIEGHGY